MAITKAARNKIFHLVQDAKDLLMKEVAEQLQQFYGIGLDGSVLMVEQLTTDQSDIVYTAGLLRQRLEHLEFNLPAGEDRKVKAVIQLVREQAFTILNRFASLRMAEERGIIKETIRKEYNSEGFQVFDSITGGGKTADQYTRYKWYLYAVFDELALDLPSLFDRFSPYALIFPSEQAMRSLLALINNEEITYYREEGAALQNLWREDETIGWIYQYYNSRQEITEMRDASSAPRNSQELAVRNQFFTPRYVVQFLADNSLGRLWYEMTRGKTTLVQFCEYMVHPKEDEIDYSDSPELKDPREILMLDPACGSMHFGLYSFDLLEAIYREAWDDHPLLMTDLRQSMTRQQFLQQVPELIIRHNIHGVDIDPRALQIAALSLWLRAQKSFEKLGLKAEDRPAITRSNLVLAEAMPGNATLLSELVKPLEKPMRQLILTIWEKMQLAGETGLILKIEEEIDNAIREIAAGLTDEAKKAQVNLDASEAEKLAAEQAALYASRKYRDSFLQNAETKVLQILKQLAETAINGDAYQKLLFADDTARGFAFIELCKKRYDVILMNPPFGATTTKTKELIDSSYPLGKNDLASAFIERMHELLDISGTIGAITTRTIFFLGSYLEWRQQLIIQNTYLKVFADLGIGVLDATVETAAYLIGKKQCATSSFIRATKSTKKAEAILDSLKTGNNVFKLNTSQLKLITNEPLCYWVDEKTIKRFQEQKFESADRFAISGLQTADNVRFCRNKWEIDNGNIAHDKSATDKFKWSYILIGDYSLPFFFDANHVVNYFLLGKELKAFPNTRPNDTMGVFYKEGLSWSIRTSKFEPHIIPAGCISTKSRYIAKFKNRDEILATCSLWNSEYYDYLLKLSLEAESGNPKFIVGVVNESPFPDLPASLRSALIKETKQNHSLLGELFTIEETSGYFKLPLSNNKGGSLKEEIATFQSTFERNKVEFRNSISRINDLIYGYFNVSADEKALIKESINRSDSKEEEKLFTLDNSEFGKKLFSWVIGCVFGRWDVRFVKDHELLPAREDIFSPLPKCSPGSLVNGNGLPATRDHIVGKGAEITAKEYPVPVLWDGIGVVEPGHQSDLLANIRKVLGYIWNEKSSEIEKELADLLGVQELEDWLINPNKFFNSHLNQYTQNKRTAPIYWPLSTRSGDYTIWIYYPVLNDQTLYTAVNNFLQPKQKEVAEEIKKLELNANLDNKGRKALQDLEAFLDELQEMEAEILRIAQLPYKPNHDDGVLITAAPLHKLFRHAKWKKATEDAWKALEKGEYDWSYLAHAIWPERVNKKCKKDLSMAIAHGLEAICEVKPKEKKEKKKENSTKKITRELDFE